MEYHSRSDHLAKPPQRTANYAERFALQIEAEGYGSGSLAKYSATAKALWSAMDAAKLSPAGWVMNPLRRRRSISTLISNLRKRQWL